MRTLFAIALVLGCGKSGDGKSHGDKPPTMEEMKSEAAVEWARKELPELEKRLASDDPGAASSRCAVIKPDLKAIEKADPELAATVRQRCGHDLDVRSLTVAVGKAEVARKADPKGILMECSGVKVDLDEIAKAGLGSDAEVVALTARAKTPCP